MFGPIPMVQDWWCTNWVPRGADIVQAIGPAKWMFQPRSTMWLAWGQLMLLQIKCTRGILGLGKTFVGQQLCLVTCHCVLCRLWSDLLCLDCVLSLMHGLGDSMRSCWLASCVGLGGMTLIPDCQMPSMHFMHGSYRSQTAFVNI